MTLAQGGGSRHTSLELAGRRLPLRGCDKLERTAPSLPLVSERFFFRSQTAY